MKVLIADDSAMMRTIIGRSVQASGVTDIVQAADGEEAVQLFESNEIDFVITDWNMPGKTGIEVLRAIREKKADLPVIMITTEADRAKVMEAIQAGVTDYLAKPFTPEQLIEKLEKHGCSAYL